MTFHYRCCRRCPKHTRRPNTAWRTRASSRRGHYWNSRAPNRTQSIGRSFWAWGRLWPRWAATRSRCSCSTRLGEVPLRSCISCSVCLHRVEAVLLLLATWFCCCCFPDCCWCFPTTMMKMPSPRWLGAESQLNMCCLYSPLRARLCCLSRIFRLNLWMDTFLIL